MWVKVWPVPEIESNYVKSNQARIDNLAEHRWRVGTFHVRFLSQLSGGSGVNF